MIRHIVLFSAKAGCCDGILRDLRALEEIPSALLCQVGRNLRLDAHSKEIDVVVYAEFDDTPSLDAFKNHPIYLETVNKVKPQRELRFVADLQC